jgi:histidinol-phosphate phosphatase family protein
VAFLDDDVLVTRPWLSDLATDLAAQPAEVVGVQGIISVPLPADRRPTDWERGTAGLATARWITADMAYRRTALSTVGGFDERFRRAFREDADLALRLHQRGYRLVSGQRRTTHPVRPARWNASLRQQRGNADDALMRAVHGPGWHRRADAPVGRRPTHVVTTGVAVIAAGAAVTRRRATALLAAGAWVALTARFAWTRIKPGPRTSRECGRMLSTSVLIPPAATGHWLHGLWTSRGARAWAPESGIEHSTIEAVLIDRDGTLVHDVPYNGDPTKVRVIDDVPEGIARLRAAGVKIGVITNQSGLARGLIRPDQVAAVNTCIDDAVGPFDTWQICPHDDADRCPCRKPAPGLVTSAARVLNVPVERCAVIGDTAADVGAGNAAGAALSVLVPNAATRADEIHRAHYTAVTFVEAVDLILARMAAAVRQ